MTTCYLFQSPAVGAVYEELVRFGCTLASEALLVVRDPDADPGHSISDILSKLSRFLNRASRVREWPGTQLLDDEATIFRYHTSQDLASALIATRSGLFEWLHPEAPEDLCFARADGSPIVVTISHEKEAYLLLTADERVALVASYPRLASALVADSSTE